MFLSNAPTHMSRHCRNACLCVHEQLHSIIAADGHACVAHVAHAVLVPSAATEPAAVAGSAAAIAVATLRDGSASSKKDRFVEQHRLAPQRRRDKEEESQMSSKKANLEAKDAWHIMFSGLLRL